MFTNEGSNLSPPSSWYMSDTSENAPTLVNVGDQVLPISVTSGVFWGSGNWVVSLFRASPQACSSIVRVPPVVAAYCFFRYSRSASGVSPPMTQNVMFWGVATAALVGAAALEVVSVPDDAHPVRASAPAARMATEPSIVFFIRCSFSLCMSSVTPSATSFAGVYETPSWPVRTMTAAPSTMMSRPSVVIRSARLP